MRTTTRLVWAIAPFVLAFILLATSNSAIAGRASPPCTVRVPLTSPPSPKRIESGGGPIEPELLRALLEAEPNDCLRVIIHLREQADLEAAIGGTMDAAEIRSRVVSALQATAARSQASLVVYLEGARTAGDVESYASFWIVNAIAVQARPSIIRSLAACPEVASVRLDHYRQWLTAETPNPQSAIHNPQSVEWGVSRIRADEVWASLHISGSGAVVAGMDTGVDWLHPALQANYRGYNSHGPSNHTYSWHDATGGGALYPVDAHGHGSHTMGTVVGQDGIGVAPGARWIAVRVMDKHGFGYDSWFHAGFQWLLAPGGDPDLAPDVVNCSWGNSNGVLTTFRPDIQALQAAGIFVAFANGNDGPGSSTVSSPASLPEAFAVGATDPDDEVANFSSRGPSPWGEVRPHVAAPGVGVRSSLPGGAYGLVNGTSMATAHVSGVAALLRSVSSTLSIAHTAFVITSTAIPLGDPIPNNDTGWGRVDAFAAVSVLARSGFISGTVARAEDGAPIAGAQVSAVPRGGGGGRTATTGETGAYLLALAPATYDLTASAFGYESAAILGTEVEADVTSVVNFSLTSLSTGILRGHITDAATGAPITATAAVVDTPLQTTASAYAFTLPAGDYVVRAHGLGYRVVTATAHIAADQVTTADFALTPAPTILLVDSGAWYYESQVGYFRQALDDLTYAYDEWIIKHVPGDVPAASDLMPYDIVVWTAPWDAPAYIGAQGAITGYLSAGGRLFLSGQDVGFLDGGGSGSYYAPYYWDYLKVYLVRDNAETWALEGVPGDIFAGLTITITGPGGADNQSYPDEIAVADPDAAASVLAYREDGCGGVRIGTCLDYRAIYLSFGFEAVNAPAARREVMGRALEWLVADPPAVGLELTPAAQTSVGPAGAVVTHTLRVRNVGQAGLTDTINLTLDGASWTSQLSVSSLTLSPCTSATVVVSVTVPPSAAPDARDVVTLTARSSLSPTLSRSVVLTTKAPAPILLVDDDRWYDQEAQYEAALADRGFAYDYWRTGESRGEPPAGSPPLHVLQYYPIVVWFTGYDWYAPVTAGEEAALTAYLDGGGRLFLSSQDFLYYHHDAPFAEDYLGVVTYTEDVTPTQAAGVPEDSIGDRLGPYSLGYPFYNWSDAVVPAPGTAVSFRDQGRRPIALARQANDYKAVFFSFPYETLPEEARPQVMERIVGWLSWLGGSTFAPDRWAASSGDVLTYTIAPRNDGPAASIASLSNTLPVSLTLVPGSLTGPSTALRAGPATYSPSARCISWEGVLESGATVTVTYQVTLPAELPAGDSIVNTVGLGLEDQDIRFRRSAVVRVDAPDLSPSSLQCDPSKRSGGVVTCTLVLVNVGSGDALAATAAVSLPVGAALVPGSLTWEGGGVAEEPIGAVCWAGPLDAQAQVTLTYQLILPTSPARLPLYSVAFLEDGAGGAWERPTWLLVEPWRAYLPAVYRRFAKPRGVYLPVVMRNG